MQQESSKMSVRKNKTSTEDEKQVNGCIKNSKGPWIVRRKGKDGVPKISMRVPSERERENNRLREQRRRRVAGKIYAGLKKHGNYNLPKSADQNDVLIALCKEAGWHVEDDGTIHRIDPTGVSNDSTPIAQEESAEEKLSLDLTLAYKYM